MRSKWSENEKEKLLFSFLAWNCVVSCEIMRNPKQQLTVLEDKADVDTQDNNPNVEKHNMEYRYKNTRKFVYSIGVI